jgi:hypothetical protein
MRKVKEVKLNRDEQTKPFKTGHFSVGSIKPVQRDFTISSAGH